MTRPAALAHLAAALMAGDVLLEYEVASHVVSAVQIGDGDTVACAADQSIAFTGSPVRFQAATGQRFAAVRYE